MGKIYLVHFLKFWNLPRFTWVISKCQKYEYSKFIPNFPLKHVITSTNKTANNLVNPSARLISTNDLFGNLVDTSTSLTGTSNMTNVSVCKMININKYSSLSKGLLINSWVYKAKDKIFTKLNTSIQNRNRNRVSR